VQVYVLGGLWGYNGKDSKHLEEIQEV
jgi:hypothetical protein